MKVTMNKLTYSLSLWCSGSVSVACLRVGAKLVFSYHQIHDVSVNGLRVHMHVGHAYVLSP